MANSLRIIDADAHVIETERTWDYLAASEHKHRPKLFSTPDDATRQYWVIDDKIAGFRFPTLSERELHEFARTCRQKFRDAASSAPARRRRCAPEAYGRIGH